MGRLSTLLFGFIIGAAVVYGAFNYHVLRTSDGFQLVPKQSAHLDNTYVDIRSFGASDWASHPDLAADIVAAKKGHLMGQAGLDAVESEVRTMLNNIRQ